SNGQVVAATSEPNVDVDIDKDWLCVIIGIIAGAVIGAIAGFLLSGGNWVGAVIGGVAGGIVGGLAANHLIDPLDLDGVSLDSLSVLGGLTLPLPVGAAGLLVSACDFDDLAVGGDLVYVDLAERHRSGSVSLAGSSGFDLDAGVVRTNLAAGADDASDLLWTGTALQTVPGAALGPVFASDSNAFGTLSLSDLEGFTYAGGSVTFGLFAGTYVAAAAIPVQLPMTMQIAGPSTDWPLSGGLFTTSHWVAFALRTDEGRYAKCRARRDLSGTVTLEYVVYARPRACLGSLVTLETLAMAVVDSGTETCTEVRTEQPHFADLGRTAILHPIEPVGLHVFPIDLPGARVPTATIGYIGPTGLFEPPDRGRFLPPGFLDRPSRQDFFPPGLFEPPGHFHPPSKLPGLSCGQHSTIEHHQAAWQIVDRQQQVTIQALPSGVVAPLTYRWTVFGTELPAGSGTVTVGAIDVVYDENSPILTLLADPGDDIAGSVTVNATDADGRKLRATRHINSPSRKRIGGCCPSQPAKLTMYDAGVQLERAKTALRVYQAGSSRLRKAAAWGRVKQLETVGLAEAVGTIGKSRSPGRTPGAEPGPKKRRT
ncbi:MAG: hypothetical protein ACRDFW_13240, partial [bacterium]